MFVICSMIQERQATLLCMSNYKMKTFTQVVMKMDTELEVGCPKDEVGYLLCQNSTAQGQLKGN